MMQISSRSVWICLRAFVLVMLPVLLNANPHSRAYVPYRTDPFEQHLLLHHNITLDDSGVIKSRIHSYNQKEAATDKQCPLQFTLGLSRRSHMQQHSTAALSIVSPPVIYPVHPSRGPGRQVLHTTQYENLDLLSPSRIPLDSVIQEGLVQQEDFPLLFESSSFLTSPIVHDVNGDGIPDAMIADYDGGLYFVGLSVKEGEQRFFQRAQVPRLYLRRDWMVVRLNETVHGPREVVNYEEDVYDPFHSHFEYGDNRHVQDDVMMQGVPADVLRHDGDDLDSLDKRRSRRVKREKTMPPDNKDETEKKEEEQPADKKEGEQQPVEKKEGEEQPLEKKHDEQQTVEKKQDEQQVDMAGGEVIEEAMHRRLQEADQIELDGEAAKDPAAETGGQDEPKGEEKAEEANNERGQDEPKGKEKAEEANNEPEPAGGAEAQAEAIGEKSPEEMAREAFQEHGHDEEPSVLEERREDDWEAIRGGEEGMPGMDDDAEAGMGKEGMHDDAYPYGYDDYYYGQYKRNEVHDKYYDDANYIRIPPHVLCSPVFMELPKLYAPNDYEVEDIMFLAVSYYLDEDEYEGFFSYKRFENVDMGDETEVQRGFYVANAIMVYNLGKSPRWGRQEHLDLSADPTAPQNMTLVGSYPIIAHEEQMGAFALSSPTIADIDGDSSYEVLLGTSMGIVYCFDARHMFKKDGWPVQMKGPIESRILVEDVVGDTNLEVFVADTKGNVVCFDKAGTVIWHRDVLKSISERAFLIGSSPMTLGDVNGDGVLDIVLAVKTREAGRESVLVVALDAATGKDLANFPIAMEPKPTRRTDTSLDDEVHQRLPQPLLVDLHSDQSQWDSYLLRNGTKSTYKPIPKPRPPHGGTSPGLHIVQPVSSDLLIIEAGSGCIQKIDIGDEITAMVQADDVHGSNRLDLVVSTAAGNIVTLESPAVPYHPLNVWNNGETRGRMNSFAQGFTASQGIFVHDVSRQYRDIFGVYVPVTFEIFDNRPNIRAEPEKRIYKVEIRDGTSNERALFRKHYNETGIYTERMYVSYGPGYYTLAVFMRTSHGLVYEDTFHLGYNVHYMDGFGLLLWLPLLLASIPIILCGKKKRSWDDEDDDGSDERGSRGLGILGRAMI